MLALLNKLLAFSVRHRWLVVAVTLVVGAVDAAAETGIRTRGLDQ